MATVHHAEFIQTSPPRTEERLADARQEFNRAADRARFRVFGRFLLGNTAYLKAKDAYSQAAHDHIEVQVAAQQLDNGNAHEVRSVLAFLEHQTQLDTRHDMWYESAGVYQRSEPPEKRLSYAYLRYKTGLAKEETRDVVQSISSLWRRAGVKEPDWDDTHTLRRPSAYATTFTEHELNQLARLKRKELASRKHRKAAIGTGVLAVAAATAAVAFNPFGVNEKLGSIVPGHSKNDAEQVASKVAPVVSPTAATNRLERKHQVQVAQARKKVKKEADEPKWRTITDAPNGFWAQQNRTTGSYVVYASRSHAGLWQISETAAEHRAGHQLNEATIARIVRDIREARLKQDIVSDELDFKERVVVAADSIDSAIAAAER